MIAERICFLLKIAPSGAHYFGQKRRRRCLCSGYYSISHRYGAQICAAKVYAMAFYDAFGVHSTTDRHHCSLNTGASFAYVSAAKLDTPGHAIWAKSFSDGSVTGMNTIAVTNIGNIYLSGNHYWDSTLVLEAIFTRGTMTSRDSLMRSGTVICANNFDVF